MKNPHPKEMGGPRVDSKQTYGSKRKTMIHFSSHIFDLTANFGLNVCMGKGGFHMIISPKPPRHMLDASAKQFFSVLAINLIKLL